MPTLETETGQAVDVTPAEVDVNRQFAQAMADDGPDTQAPPKRQPRPPADPAATKPGRSRPKKEQARTASVTVLDDTQRAQGVKGFTQIAAGITLLLGRGTGNDAFKADAVTIASAADEIADAAVQVAHADPKFAAALDKVCSAGPYAALITVAVSVGTQCARNHKPGLNLPGTIDPAELLKAQTEAEHANA